MKMNQSKYLLMNHATYHFTNKWLYEKQLISCTTGSITKKQLTINSLPDEVDLAPSTSTFKVNLDSHWSVIGHDMDKGLASA